MEEWSIRGEESRIGSSATNLDLEQFETTLQRIKLLIQSRQFAFRCSLKLNEEVKKATDVKGDVGNELPILPIGLDCYPHVHRIRDSSSSCHC